MAPDRAASRRRRVACLAALVVPALCASPALAQLHSPRVLSPHNADAYSMRTFALFPRWRDLEGDAKVYEVYRYLVDHRTGIYPMGAGAWEGRADDLYELGFVRDPVKMLNTYSLGYCDMLGPTAAGILCGMGIGPARTVNLPAWGHVASEVFYGGKWHYVDLDVRAVFRRPDGSLASLEEARADDSLWRGPRSPLFFPLDDLERTQRVYAETPVHHRHGVSQGGHTMDYLLRRGETFTRWWKPQGDRWSHHPSYHDQPGIRAILEREPRGPKPKHLGWSAHTRGNGRFVYRPDLTARSRDFEDAVFDSRNVRPGERGLTLIEPGEGFAVFEVRSPYVIVPEVGAIETSADDRGASVASIEADGCAASISLDGGLSWKELGAPAGPLDLTPHVSGSYGYLLRLALAGEPGKAAVRALEVVTWVQLHPASLPSLRRGANRMRFVTGDHHGLQSRLVEVRVSASDREAFLRRLSEPPADYDPARRTSMARGPFTARVDAPPGVRIAWFSAGGSFQARQGAEAPLTANSMAWAAGEPRGFQEFHRAAVPPGNSHWHYNADVEVKLEKPARTIFVRCVGDPGVNALRIYAHAVEDRPRPPPPVTITHAFLDGETHRTHTVTLDGPGEYEVTAAADPVDEWIELSVSSGAR